MLFAVIGWGDYADGIAARRDAPVQPPRGADGPGHRPPAGDLRAWSSAGTSSCCRAGRWRCSRARELAMLALGRYGLTRGVELRINWPGRLRSRR